MSDLSIPEPAHYPQALDIQHDTDPERDHGVARRIPHLGHAALFLFIALFCVFFCITLAVAIGLVVHPHPGGLSKGTLTATDIHLAALGQLAGYAITFAIAVPVFPLMWKRGFFDGISWTFRAARLRWWKLILLGIAMSLIAQLSEHFVKLPKDIDILKLLDTPLTAWLTAVSAALIAPVVEEIAFRGFLLPALATAYDWLCLERTPAALNRWRLTTSHTPAAVVLASVVSSAAFAALHGSQLHWPLGMLVILFTVSLLLSAVRVRFHSVAASSLVHISYNSLLFIQMIFATGGFRHLDRLSH